jgi:uncharacterized protein YbjT (DUF2867 family)
MRCVVFGATGYIGARLIPELLAAGHSVQILVRDPKKLSNAPWRDQVSIVEGDVTDSDQVAQAVVGQDVLYYLVHSLMRSDFVDLDAQAASIVGAAAARAGLSRIVYLGGIVPRGQRLSYHLASRAEVGQLLRESGVPTVELRAAAIIGSGSASFETLRYLAERLPVIIAPPWLRTRIQPIAVRDVLYYLTNAAHLPRDVNRCFDIGGPDRLRYLDMIRKYTAVAELPRPIIVPAPPVSLWLSAQAVGLITPIPRPLTESLMESLENEMVCGDHAIAEHIPDPEGGLAHYEEAIELALARVRVSDVLTRWSRPGIVETSSDPLPTDPGWSGGTLYEDLHERRTPADAATLWQVIESIGAEHGWYSFPLAWSLRGWINELTGRIGLRLGRRNVHQLHVGEALDWWRVERIDKTRLLRLRSENMMPGRLWLELTLYPDGDGQTIYRQRSLFQPYGLAGLAFWKASVPFRDTIFGGIARNITGAAEHQAATENPTADDADEMVRTGTDE